MKDYMIRTSSFSELQMAISWAATEGWNPGLDDALAFALIDCQGFFVGTVNNKQVAFISNVKYPEGFGFVGLYIVVPEYRGQGYGKAIMEHALAYNNTNNIALDAVIEQQKNYEKLGFSIAYKNFRYVLENSRGNKVDKNLLYPATECPMEKILEYDRQFFPSKREAFLTNWLFMPNAHSLVALEDDVLVGYGVIRKCQAGYKIGPLYANDYTIAQKIFAGLCIFADNSPVFLDIPELNQHALTLVRSQNMGLVFQTSRMYTKEVPDIALDKTYGITTFEVG